MTDVFDFDPLDIYEVKYADEFWKVRDPQLRTELSKNGKPVEVKLIGETAWWYVPTAAGWETRTWSLRTEKLRELVNTLARVRDLRQVELDTRLTELKWNIYQYQMGRLPGTTLVDLWDDFNDLR